MVVLFVTLVPHVGFYKKKCEAFFVVNSRSVVVVPGIMMAGFRFSCGKETCIVPCRVMRGCSRRCKCSSEVF